MFYTKKGGAHWSRSVWITFILICFVTTSLLLVGSVRLFWHSSYFLKIFAREASFLMSSSKELTVEIKDIHTYGIMNVSLEDIKIREKLSSPEAIPLIIQKLTLNYGLDFFSLNFKIQGEIIIDKKPVNFFVKGPLLQVVNLSLKTSNYAHGSYESSWVVSFEKVPLKYFLKFLLSGFATSDFFFTQINGLISGKFFYQDKPPFDLKSRRGKATVEISQLTFQDQKIINKLNLDITLENSLFKVSKAILLQMPQTSLQVDGTVQLEAKEKNQDEIKKNPWLVYVRESYLPYLNLRVTTEKKSVSWLGCDLDHDHILHIEGPLAYLQCHISAKEILR